MLVNLVLTFTASTWLGIIVVGYCCWILMSVSMTEGNLLFTRRNILHSSNVSHRCLKLFYFRLRRGARHVVTSIRVNPTKSPGLSIVYNIRSKELSCVFTNMGEACNNSFDRTFYTTVGGQWSMTGEKSLFKAAFDMVCSPPLCYL